MISFPVPLIRSFVISILHLWALPRRFLDTHPTHAGLEPFPLETLCRHSGSPQHDGKQYLSSFKFQRLTSASLTDCSKRTWEVKEGVRRSRRHSRLPKVKYRSPLSWNSPTLLHPPVALEAGIDGNDAIRLCTPDDPSPSALGPRFCGFLCSPRQLFFPFFGCNCPCSRFCFG